MTAAPASTNDPARNHGFVQPLLQAHAHNDYEHRRPLLDALDQGFCSVEADIWLVEGRLLVAHNRSAVKPERTLQALYLDPLRERAKTNGNRIFPEVPSLTLLVDVKSDADRTYEVLRKVLGDYRQILTEFTAGATRTGAVTVILSGNIDRELVGADLPRWVALDGRPPDLDSQPPATLVPLISDAWTKHFTWRGDGAMPDSDQRKLDQFVRRAHEQGRRLRFWGIPDQPVCWKVLRDAGVDVISTDNLSGLAAFLSK